MMQVTQNVEMKELQKETALLITMTPEPNSEEVEQLRSPNPSQSRDTTVKQNGLKCTTTDAQDKLSNGQTQETIDKPYILTSSAEQERNAGTDLDALLDKISSIVDRSPKEFHVANDGDDSNQLDQNKSDLNQMENEMKGHNITKKNIVSEHEANLSKNSDEKNIKKSLEVNVLSKSTNTIGQTIEESNRAKNLIQTDAVAEQVDKAATLEDSSFDEIINQEKKVCKSKTNSSEGNGKSTGRDQTQEADVIIDLDSSDEGMADEVTKLSEKTTRSKQTEAKQKEDIGETVEEPHGKLEKEKKKEAKLIGLVNETEMSSYLNTMLKNSDVSDALTIDTNGEESKSNSSVKADKVANIDGFKENEDQDKPVEAEYDDDDVIFFELIDKGKEKEKTNEMKKKETERLLEIKAEPLKDKKDVEIFLVSEDEEDDLRPIKKKSEGIEKEVNNGTDKDFQADNSDNACDQFDKLKPQAKPKSLSINDHIDNNSNSSNLLRPAEDTDIPPKKRKRLSTEVCPKVVEETKPETTTTESEKPMHGKRGHNLVEISPSDIKMHGKRGHNLVEISPSDIKKNQTLNKKLKSDDTDSNSSNDGTLQIDLDAKEETEDVVLPCKEDGEKYQLIPQPDLKTEVKPIRLDFVKTFRKSFDKMSRQDLEELVLQKVVEGMLVKSEFADIRRQLDKYEITLANYRRKIAEVSKQFVDLETVHKRVLKDLETKNSQFTAPVRITRAVGLQVGMSMKAMKSEAPIPAQLNSVGGNSALPSGTLSKASTSPLRSPLRGVQSARSPHQQVHPHQQQSRSSALQSSSSASTSSPIAKTLQPPIGSTPVRRGCMQKVTPQRPGPGHHIVAAATSTPTNRSPQGGRPTLSVHVSKHTGGNSGAVSAVPTTGAMASVTTMRARSGTTPYGNIPQKQQQQTQQYQTSRPGAGPSPNKSTVKMPAKVRPIPTVSVPITSAAAGGSPPNLSPAKPKDKSVIDLTDEDEAAAAAAAIQSRLSQSASVTMKKSAGHGGGAGPVGGMVRSGSSAAGNVVRVSPMPGPSCRTNVVSRLSGGGQRNTLGSNVTMQIRSENTPPSASRLRYSHPAPLPSSPAQPFNPVWKLPPSRPVIRISLHDSGIVISWTLEDTSNRFSDCVTYQIYAYQETIHEPSTDSWRHVGDVKAMLLPMAVTLNQFQENQRYYFAVRGVDEHQRFGPFSLPKTWS